MNLILLVLLISSHLITITGFVSADWNIITTRQTQLWESNVFTLMCLSVLRGPPVQGSISPSDL